MSELRRCEDCLFEKEGYCQHKTLWLDRQMSVNEARNEYCGISAIYFTPKEPTDEELEAMFDRNDEQPKTPNYDIFSKEKEEIF